MECEVVPVVDAITVMGGRCKATNKTTATWGGKWHDAQKLVRCRGKLVNSSARFIAGTRCNKSTGHGVIKAFDTP